MSLKAFVPSLLVLALSACAVGPDYKAPQTEAANITTATDGAAGQKNFDRARFEGIWWQQFDDPTLNALVTRSLEGNRELRVAFARLRAARAIRDDASNDAMPTITSRASSNLGKGQIPGQTTDRVNTERYDLGLDMAWELDLFGRIQRNLEATDANQQAIEADLYQLQVTMIAELVDAYGQLRGAQLREKIALANLKNQQDSRKITESLRDAGVGDQLDVVRADARLASVEASVPQLQAEQVRQRNRIATLLGERPDKLSVDLSPKQLPAIAKALPIGDPGELLQRRPDILSAERQLAAATCAHRRGQGRPVPTGQPERFPRFHGWPRLADRLLGGQRLGAGPEHYLGGFRPGQRTGSLARCRRRGGRRPGDLRTASAAGSGRIGKRLQ